MFVFVFFLIKYENLAIQKNLQMARSKLIIDGSPLCGMQQNYRVPYEGADSKRWFVFRKQLSRFLGTGKIFKFGEYKVISLLFWDT